MIGWFANAIETGRSAGTRGGTTPGTRGGTTTGPAVSASPEQSGEDRRARDLDLGLPAADRPGRAGEFVAAFDTSKVTAPWTDYIVTYLPPWLTFALVGLLIAWLPAHLATEYRRRGKPWPGI
jgi:hypothetical protein